MATLNITFYTKSGAISRESTIDCFEYDLIKNRIDDLIDYMGYNGVRDAGEIIDRNMTKLENGDIHIDFS